VELELAVMDDEPLPIKLGPVSNGEFLPVPHDDFLREVIRRTNVLADENARRAGMSRRRFLGSAAGAATMLFVLAACADAKKASQGERSGGTFNVPEETTVSSSAALDTVGGDEFVFDVQTHYVNYDLAAAGGEWTSVFPFAQCDEGNAAGNSKACFTADAYFREMYVRSDTSMSILSALPTPGGTGLGPDDMAYAIDVATRIGCDGRVLMHGGAYPHRGPIETQLDAMSELREKYDIAAWKIYTMVPTAAAFFFDDHDPNRPQIGQRFIDHVREIGPNIICTHKGISSIVGSSPELASPSDIGHAAARNPDVNFVVYHSGFEPRHGGLGAYDAGNATQGVDRFVKTLQDNGIEPNSNVYAELGGTWWYLMRDPTAAAHVIGKLLKYVGEDRVVWGTDSIWFGTPQDQIQAMRTFEISEELQDKHGYPALTKAVKAKIFGLNSAHLYGVEPVTEPCEATPEEVDAIRAAMPAAQTYGPTTYLAAARMIEQHQAGYLL
jgi:predicted TIM-barrel fold metal-dependent hydrolase